MFKVSNKDTRTTPLKRRNWRRFVVFIVNFKHIALCASVSIVNFEHVIAEWN